MTRIETLRLIVAEHQARLIDNMWVDVQTANMLVTIHGALSEANHEKFETLPLVTLVNFGWKHVTPTFT